MNKTLMAGLLALVLTGCANSQSEQPFSLTVAHINDTHSHFDGSDVRLNIANKTVYTRAGGHARLLSYANTLRQQAAEANRPFLFLHAGDAWQGSSYFNLNQGVMSADILSRMQLDAMTLGEREFSLNNEKLATFIEQLNFPVLAANLDATQDADLHEQENLQPYVLYAIKGSTKKRIASVKDAGKYPVVAVIGLVQEDMPKVAVNVGQLSFAQEVKRAQQTVNALKAQGVSHIVALTHLGLARDQRLAEQVNGIDVIVGGHSHHLLGDFSAIGLGKNEPYARRFTNPDGWGTTCVVQAGHFGQAIGQVTVTFTYDGRVSQCEGGNTLLVDQQFYRDVRRGDNQRVSDAQQQQITQAIVQQANIAMVEEDATLHQYIAQHYQPALLKASGKVIGHVPQTLTHELLPVDGQGSQVAPLVAASQLYWVNTPKVQAVTKRKVDFAILAAGSVRRGIEIGELKAGQVGMGLLFADDPISLVSLTGHQVAGLLLETINGAIARNTTGSQFPYVAGLRYQFNETSRGRGYLSRIEYFSQQEKQWHRIEPNEPYQVALTDYYASGNDAWQTLYNAQQVLTDRLDLAFVEGKLTAFPVARLNKNAQGITEVHYINQALNCQKSNTSCHTHTQAFVDYVRDQRPMLKALPESGVVLKRL